MPFLITDVLASEYGWTKDYILCSLYFDDVRALLPFIRKRQIEAYRMQLAITENPHREDTSKLWGILDYKTDNYYEEEQLDKAGFELFKKKIAKEGGVVVK